MRMRAALILSVGKRQEPVSNVHVLKRDVHDGGNSRMESLRSLVMVFFFPVIKFRLLWQGDISR
jgi:hypothetical protein